MIEGNEVPVYRIRAAAPEDAAAIRNILEETGKFRPDEISVALELVDAAAAQGEESGYIVVVCVSDPTGLPQGYACYGPTPLTLGTWDLYWIAVAPSAQGRGLGGKLLRYVERDACARGGRLLIIETSSQESYGATVRFYEKASYRLASRIEDFYRPGDDKLVFVKRIGASG